MMKGSCWPGTSVWLDYFNEGARKFWKSLYRYEFFKGTSDLFHIWIDMNEAAVFNGSEGTIAKDALHYSSS